jgi:G3E family GTPase
MELHQALANAEAALAKVEREHADLLAQAEVKQTEVEDLRQEITGLEKAIARHERRPTSTDETKGQVVHKDSDSRGWTGVPRTKAVEQMMVDAGRPVSPRELSQMLQAVGRDDTPDVVGRALYHLQLRNRAKSVGRAQWVAVKRPSAGLDNGSVQNQPNGEEVSGNQEMSRAGPAFTGGEQRP